MVDKGLIACVTIGLLLGAIFASMYYIPSYNNAIQQRNVLSQELRNVESECSELHGELTTLKTQLHDARYERDKILEDYNEKEHLLNRALSSLSNIEDSYEDLSYQHSALNNEYATLENLYSDQSEVLTDVRSTSYTQQQQLDQVSGMLEDAYNQGYVDGRAGSSSDSSFIDDMLKILPIFFI